MLQREVFGDLWRGSAGMFGTLLAAVSAQYEQGAQYFGINPFLKSDISFVMGIVIGGLSIVSLIYRIAESRAKAIKDREDNFRESTQDYSAFKRQRDKKVAAVKPITKEDDYYR